MKLPVWRRYTVRTPTLHLTKGTISVFVGAVTLLSLTGVAVGYAVGAKTGVQPVTAAVYVPAKNSASDQSVQLKVMNEQMAEMQARLLKLDALGQHLAESANLKSKEFQFDAKNSSGGPLTDDLRVLGSTPNINIRLKELAGELDRKEAQMEALDSVLAGKRLQDNSQYLGNLPVRHGSITSTYGYRTDPFTGRSAFHAGIDFAGAEGTDIYAVAPGVVVYSGPRNGYGNAVEIDHGNGYMTRYGHVLSSVVKAGDRVAKDQLIAFMGSTGRSTGPHLHYEVLLNDHQIDPATFVQVAMRK